MNVKVLHISLEKLNDKLIVTIEIKTVILFLAGNIETTIARKGCLFLAQYAVS